ncbi:MAG: ATP-binding protein, partial [Clostridia bacterium]|nr:ATP-binding protein [Clostridia bacterium]
MKLILQPLVENAILHGFRDMRNSGFILIRASIDEDNIVINIEDNGRGFKPDSVDKILKGGKDAPGYGIRNVNERIKLKFGEDYGLSYTLRPDGGTIATITMPKIEKNN